MEQARRSSTSPKRYWGIFSAAICMSFFYLLTTKPLYFVIWAWIARDAYKGNGQSIFTVVKFFLILNLILGFVVVFFFSQNELYFGSLEVIIVTALLATVVKVGVLWSLWSEVHGNQDISDAYPTRLTKNFSSMTHPLTRAHIEPDAETRALPTDQSYSENRVELDAGIDIEEMRAERQARREKRRRNKVEERPAPRSEAIQVAQYEDTINNTPISPQLNRGHSNKVVSPSDVQPMSIDKGETIDQGGWSSLYDGSDSTTERKLQRLLKFSNEGSLIAHFLDMESDLSKRSRLIESIIDLAPPVVLERLKTNVDKWVDDLAITDVELKDRVVKVLRVVRAESFGKFQEASDVANQLGNSLCIQSFEQEFLGSHSVDHALSGVIKEIEGGHISGQGLVDLLNQLGIHASVNYEKGVGEYSVNQGEISAERLNFDEFKAYLIKHLGCKPNPSLPTND